jgi:gluconate 2-dehydrogenase gamma chain
MDKSQKPESRRGFLGVIAAVIPALSIASCAPFSALKHVTAKIDRHRFFTEEEWAFLNAACGRLIPADDSGPGAVELAVPEFIDREMDGLFGHAVTWYMQGPFVSSVPELGYQSSLTPREVYRAGIAAVNTHCRNEFGNKTFPELPPATQNAVLSDLESGALDFDAVSGKSFFNFLLQNTKEGYLADPIHGGNKEMGSWKMIGFPGARADFSDWVDKYGARYPIGPVGVDGGRG